MQTDGQLETAPLHQSTAQMLTVVVVKATSRGRIHRPDVHSGWCQSHEQWTPSRPAPSVSRVRLLELSSVPPKVFSGRKWESGNGIRNQTQALRFHQFYTLCKNQHKMYHITKGNVEKALQNIGLSKCFWVKNSKT